MKYKKEIMRGQKIQKKRRKKKEERKKGEKEDRQKRGREKSCEGQRGGVLLLYCRTWSNKTGQEQA